MCTKLEVSVLSMQSHSCLLSLCLLVLAAIHAGATSTKEGRSSGKRLMRRHDKLETAETGSSQQGNSGLEVQRLLGIDTELHVSGQRLKTGDEDAADSTIGRSPPMFLQMGASTDSEPAGDLRDTNIHSTAQSSAVEDNSLASLELGLRSGDNSDEAISAVKDLSDRSVVKDSPERSTSSIKSGNGAVLGTVTSNTNGFLGWMSSLVTIADATEADKMGAVDGLGGSEDEANYSMDTEGFWLLTCMLGLLLFSCLMVCVSKLSAACACDRSPSMAELGRQEAEEECSPVEKEAEGTSVAVPAFEAVINTAAEENVLNREAVGGVEELLSAVANLPADSLQDVPVTDTRSATPNATAVEGLRTRVMSIALSTGDVLEQFEASGVGYDCVLARPLTCCRLVRLHATVLHPSGGEMVAPLALQMCVLYQVTVSRRLHAGMPPVPVAFSSMSTSKFHLAPIEKPDLCVAVEGADVMLFDAVVGRFSYKGAFATAPGHLQDYVLTHRSAVPGGQWQTSSAFRSDTTPLEFQECALLVGSQVTVVGELARDPGGDLVLRPAYLGPLELSDSPQVLVSDDPQLYDQFHC